MKLSEYIDLSDLDHEIAAGFVSMRQHDDDPKLAILAYTKKAQAEGRWNGVTTKTRGLIVRMGEGGDGDIIARPFVKFWNYGEHPEGTFDLDAQVLATDKQDGSLAILHPHPKGGWAIATRGSFHSEQAIRGTEILQRYVSQGFEPWEQATYLFEIVYPENRIVVDYGDLEDLIPLACYHTERGEPAGLGDPFPEEIYARFNPPETRGGTLRDVLALPPRPNAEGWVVRFEDGTRVKVKQEDYIRLHRIVTGLNELTVWEWMRDHDRDISGLIATLPEEFEGWVRDVADGLIRKWGYLSDRNWGEWDEVAREVWLSQGREVPADEITREERKAVASAAARFPHPGLIFMILDSKFQQRSDTMWKMVRPKGAGQGARRELSEEVV